MANRVDLNCDMGEAFGRYDCGNDAALLGLVTSANIACGFHAGDADTMRRTARLALEKNVAIGAHPGLPDLQGFGRRDMKLTPNEAHNIVLYQIGALHAFAAAAGARLHHVKPHGALYNMAARDAALSRAIADAVRSFDPRLVLYGLAGSELVKSGRTAKLTVAEEAFADRNYERDGSLTPRSRSNASIADPVVAAERALRMVVEKKVASADGSDVAINADTICIHGDGDHAVEFARAIRSIFDKNGITVSRIGGA